MASEHEDRSARNGPGGAEALAGKVQVVVSLLEELGWRDVIEFEQLSAARGMEMWLPLWIRLMGRLGTADFNLKIVR